MADQNNSDQDVLDELLGTSPNAGDGNNNGSDQTKREGQKPGKVEPGDLNSDGVKIIDDMGNYHTRI